MTASRSHSFALVSFVNPKEKAAEEPVPGLAYTKALYDNVLGWYKDVQARAQHAVTLDGAFVTILSGVIFAKGTDLKDAIKLFGNDTWVFLALTGVSFLLSFVFAITALIPRGLSRRKLDASFAKYRDDDERHGRRPPSSVMWYSPHVKRYIDHLDRQQFLEDLKLMGDRQQQAALASQIAALAERLERKYRAVFVSYACSGTALVALLITVGSYLLDVDSQPAA